MTSAALPEIVALTVEQYHRMIEEGILREGEPVELLDGLLVRKDRRDSGGPSLAHGVRHYTALSQFLELSDRFEALGCFLRAQGPVTLSETSEPEPDVAIVAGSVRHYRDHHPGPSEVLAVVEVADSSLAHDLGRKLEAYAAAGVPLYVVIDLKHDQVLLFEQPEPAARGYGRRRDHGASDLVTLSLGERGPVTIPAGDLLPPPV